MCNFPRVYFLHFKKVVKWRKWGKGGRFRIRTLLRVLLRGRHQPTDGDWCEVRFLEDRWRWCRKLMTQSKMKVRRRLEMVSTGLMNDCCGVVLLLHNREKDITPRSAQKWTVPPRSGSVVGQKRKNAAASTERIIAQNCIHTGWMHVAGRPTEFPIGGDDGRRGWAVLSLFPARLVSDDHSACVRRRNMHVHFPALRNQSLPRKTTPPPRVVWCRAPKSLF